MPATHAYGFILGRKCIERLAMEHYQDPNGPEISTLPPEQASIELSVACSVARMGLAREIHREFPRLPLPWYRIILLDDGQRYLLALKDNRTLVHANAKLEPEDVDGVRAKLELGPQKPKWYPLPE